MKKLILLLLFLFVYGCGTSVCPQNAYCPENAPYYSDKTGWCYSANISCPILIVEGACSYCTKEPDKIIQVKPSKTL